MNYTDHPLDGQHWASPFFVGDEWQITATGTNYGLDDSEPRTIKELVTFGFQATPSWGEGEWTARDLHR